MHGSGEDKLLIRTYGREGGGLRVHRDSVPWLGQNGRVLGDSRRYKGLVVWQAGGVVGYGRQGRATYVAVRGLLPIPDLYGDEDDINVEFLANGCDAVRVREGWEVSWRGLLNKERVALGDPQKGIRVQG